MSDLPRRRALPTLSLFMAGHSGGMGGAKAGSGGTPTAGAAGQGGAGQGGSGQGGAGSGGAGQGGAGMAGAGMAGAGTGGAEQGGAGISGSGQGGAGAGGATGGAGQGGAAGSPPVVPAPVQLTAGSFHTCALLEDGKVKCWGDNFAGQIGLGDIFPRGDDAGEMGDNLLPINLGKAAKVMALGSGQQHVCAVLPKGQVKCWGKNNEGQLGLEDNNDRGKNPSSMGDNLPFVDLGDPLKAVALGGGEDHTCARLEGGLLKCWGYNYEGQLGQQVPGGYFPLTVGDEFGEMGRFLPAINLGSTLP